MTRHDPDRTAFDAALELLTEHGFDAMASSIELLLNEAMKLERSAFLGAGPYERTEGRRGYANGYKAKHVKSRLGELELAVPKVRDADEPFYPQALERGERSERALKLAVAEMYVQGVSTRKVTEITRELCGLEVSSSQVSRAAAQLDEELEAWRSRKLGEYRYLLLDARYEKVRHGGQVVSCALLYAVGVDLDGKRSVLGVSVSLSEAEVHWRALLKDLVERGLHGVRMITSDAEGGAHRDLLRGRLAALPVPPAAERQLLRAAGRSARAGRGGHPGHLQRAGPRRSRPAPREDRQGVVRGRTTARHLDGREPARGLHGLRPPSRAPKAAPDKQPARTPQPRDQ